VIRKPDSSPYFIDYTDWAVPSDPNSQYEQKCMKMSEL
jgi:hypothetical protein